MLTNLDNYIAYYADSHLFGFIHIDNLDRFADQWEAIYA